MPATFNWCIDNGVATGSPSHGTTRSGFGSDTHYPTENYHKNADDNTENGGTPYNAAPIFWGDNSYQRYLFAKFSGSFTTISAGQFAHTAGAFGSGITLKGAATSAYATPDTTALGGLTDMTSAIPISSGASVDFSTTGPEDASPTSTLSAPGYSQYMVTQLLTTVSVPPPGDTATATITFQYLEN